jgi:acylphosphatase
MAQPSLADYNGVTCRRRASDSAERNKNIASDGTIVATCSRALPGWRASFGGFAVRRPGRIVGQPLMSRSRLNILYSGTVQGVGFRYTVRTLARGFDIAGTVRNLPDGRVELAAEGAKDELSAFRQAIRQSELGHFIRKEEVSWSESTSGLRGFEIVS